MKRREEERRREGKHWVVIAGLVTNHELCLDIIVVSQPATVSSGMAALPKVCQF